MRWSLSRRSWCWSSASWWPGSCSEPCRHPALPPRARRRRRGPDRAASAAHRRRTGRLRRRRAPSPALGAAPAVAGVTPTGDARAVAVDNSDDLTLLGFLSSGCTSCAAFWDALQEPGRLELPDRTRVVIVTKGPDREVPAEVQARDDRPGPGGDVDRRLGRVPGTGLTVLRARRRRYRAQGRAGSGQPRRPAGRAGPARRARPGHASTATAAAGAGEAALGGPAREAAADDVLPAAGIHPGDPSLYPRTLEDVFPFGHATTPAAGGPARAE